MFLEPSDHGPRQPTVANPRVRVSPRVASRHPSQILAVVDDEVGERELMRVEDEGGDAECEDGDPEVDEMRDPDGQGDVQEHEQRPHAEVNAGPGEPRVEDAEGQARGGETSSSGDVSSTTECEIAQNRMSVDLGGEDFEDRGEGEEVLPQACQGSTSAALGEF